jgi:pyruvate kinase
VTEAIGESACQIAERIGAAAIIPSTTSGSTAKLVAKFRPRIPIVAVTYSGKVKNKLALVWGVQALQVEYCNDTDLMLKRSIEAAAEEMQLSQGAMVIITAGVPFGVPGTTNLIKVEHV